MRVSDLWWHGPGFLKEKESKWPVWLPTDSQDAAPASFSDQPGISLLTVTVDLPFLNAGKSSSYRRLVRTVAWNFRFCRNAKLPKKSRNFKPLDEAEIKISERRILLALQHQYFPGIISDRPDSTERQLQRSLNVRVDDFGPAPVCR